MKLRRTKKTLAGVSALFLAVGIAPVVMQSAAIAAPIGQGFNLNASDLRFILKQIKISEAHVANTTSATGPCGALLGSGANQIPTTGQGVELPWGLRTVDGTCNNLLAGKSRLGAADNVFPRLTTPNFRGAGPRPAEFGPPPPGTPNPTSYTQKKGSVFDQEPRTASNLIVDQTSGNPAAVAAAGASSTDPDETLFISNTAPDAGLSAPYNSWFTLFGQFFDHGLDLTTKGNSGTVFVPLKPDDPLYVAGSPTNFMVLTRTTNQPGPDGIAGDNPATPGVDESADDIQESTNTTTPFVDQNQTYTSHPSHQVFLREYETAVGGDPLSTGKMLEGAAGGLSNWTEVKAQAATQLGIELVDSDVLNVPLLATDQYGRFLRGPNGYPQLVTTSGTVEGDPAAPISTSTAIRTGHAFLDDIAHHAQPVGDHDGNPSSPPVLLTPDGDAGTSDDGSNTTYDDEMLGAHFITGDGRGNENIGLSTVHHVFHSEHNRLTGDITDLLASLPATTANDALRADWANAPNGTGERLFQAARFVTEMEYQHLAFEEFARKVQPLINFFGEGGTGYNTSTNPTIVAEFAHAVYRFGHSMLTETVARRSPSGANRDIPLIEAFLNPQSFTEGGLSPDQAAGDVVRGMTRQVGNEIDEFTTEALRNNLLGLPLDLATLNMARGRDTGIPSMNSARRQFYAASSNSAVKPYESWADYNFSLRHPESLVNYMAAYGTHNSITGATTEVGKRDAATALLYGANGPDGEVGSGDDIDATSVPDDRYAFLNSIPHETVDPPSGSTVIAPHNQWVSGSNGVTTTGVDLIDFWVGGLGEKQLVFGGLLGPTFNYVFETQMENLQFGDRFYYLSRTAGLNLLTQLEGNSFAELIGRTTDAEGLPADVFSYPKYVFNLANLGTSGPIPDDATTPDYDESTLLTRMPDGTVRYGGGEHVLFNGTDGNDRVRSSEGDDTVRGNDGNDRIEGGDGNDSLIGGLGDDIMEDLNGDDVLKGGDGNDYLSSGQGAGGDLNQGGRGNDFIVGGSDTTETFAGPGDDFVYAGDADDTVFGDDGDDWIEGGQGAFNLLQGDNGAPFQDDPNEPGHDVLIGYGGEQDYDAEGGDDIMLLGPGIQRSEGMLGFDFTTHKNDAVAANSDMNFSGLLPPSVETNLDRFDLVESLSGWNLDDTLRGDSRVEADMVGHELNAAGIARVNGLAGLLPAGATSFTGGNIIIGGAGSDLIEGRGGNDIIDGDAWLNVRLSVRTDPSNPASEIGSADTMRAPYLTGSTTSLQQAVAAGTVNPGNIVIVRSIETAAAGTDVDTALFSGARAEYDITFNGSSVTVVHARGTQVDGTDTVRNAEQLRFSDQTIPATAPVTTAPSAPTIGTATAGNTSATVNWTAPANDGGSAITSYEVQVLTGGGVVRTVTGIPATATNTVVTGLTNGTAYTFRVVAVNAAGASLPSAESNVVTPRALTVPGAPTGVTAVAGDASATVSWTAPANDGGSTITEYRIQVRTGTTVVRTVSGVPGTATSAVVSGLTNGTLYNFRVRAVNVTGLGPLSTQSNRVTPVAAGGDVTAPTVTGRTPGVNAIGVVRGTNITATFSEPVSSTSVNSSTMTLEITSTGALVTAVVTLSANGRTATLNPSVTLRPSTQYTVRVTSGITDIAGNPLVPYSWSFTTRA